MDFFKKKYTALELIEGQVFLIDKPLGWTSFQVVNKIRWHLKNQTGLKNLKVGHAGTLDPLATGLLIICTGKKTKTISTLQDSEKEYTGSFHLGATTPSYDQETEVNARYSINHINDEIIERITKNFKGEILQFPPVFSALKKNGKRLYEYARRGETPKIQPRTIKISLFEITYVRLPVVNFIVRCSKGTYIRSLAFDFGKALNTGAYLIKLKRTKSGDYKIRDAFSMESVVNENSNEKIRKKA